MSLCRSLFSVLCALRGPVLCLTLTGALLPSGAFGHQTTYANPVDIDYRYNFEQMNKGISYRTGADPAVARYKGASEQVDAGGMMRKRLAACGAWRRQGWLPWQGAHREMRAVCASPPHFKSKRWGRFRRRTCRPAAALTANQAAGGSTRPARTPSEAMTPTATCSEAPRGTYYLFMTLADGYWRSTDLVHWQFIKPDRWPFHGVVAPATLVAGGRLFLMPATMRPEPLLASTDPARGNWTFWTRLMPGLPNGTWPGAKVKPGHVPPGPWDPGLFQDTDGKTYVYWDSSNVYPLYGIGMDLALDKTAEGQGKRLRFIGKPRALIRLHPDRHGWERFGRDHSDTSIKPFIEGAWMNKHDGTYYLQYAAPGTQYNVYATGVYTSAHPLGPFHYAAYNPVGYKPGGFVHGAGHGSTFKGVHGNWWNTGTNWIGYNWAFERRIDLYPAGFTRDGQMWVNTRFGDFPHEVPDHTLKPGESTFTGWMLLSYHKHAVAASQVKGHPPAAATDEDPRTFWLAAKNAPGQTLTVDLGGPRTVRAVQVNYADYKSGRYGDAPDIVTRFRLQGSSDGSHWHTIADLSRSNRGRADAYVQLAHPEHIRYVRYAHIHVGSRHLAIADLRVFGNAKGPRPHAPVLLSARRLKDTRDAEITWKPVPGAVGYNVRWGLSRKHLFETYQRFADKPTHLKLTSLDKGQRYVVAVEAFDEHGVSRLSRVMTLSP